MARRPSAEYDEKGTLEKYPPMLQAYLIHTSNLIYIFQELPGVSELLPVVVTPKERSYTGAGSTDGGDNLLEVSDRRGQDQDFGPLTTLPRSQR